MQIHTCPSHRPSTIANTCCVLHKSGTANLDEHVCDLVLRHITQNNFTGSLSETIELVCSKSLSSPRLPVRPHHMAPCHLHCHVCFLHHGHANKVFFRSDPRTPRTLQGYPVLPSWSSSASGSFTLASSPCNNRDLFATVPIPPRICHVGHFPHHLGTCFVFRQECLGRGHVVVRDGDLTVTFREQRNAPIPLLPYLFKSENTWPPRIELQALLPKSKGVKKKARHKKSHHGINSWSSMATENPQLDLMSKAFGMNLTASPPVHQPTHPPFLCTFLQKLPHSKILRSSSVLCVHWKA